MSSHQTLQLQSLSFFDSVNPLTVALLFHTTGLTGVHDSHCRGRCGQQHIGKRLICESDQWKHLCMFWVWLFCVKVEFLKPSILLSCLPTTVTLWPDIFNSSSSPCPQEGAVPMKCAAAQVNYTWVRKVIKRDFAWLLVRDRLVWVSQKLQIYWNEKISSGKATAAQAQFTQECLQVKTVTLWCVLASHLPENGVSSPWKWHFLKMGSRVLSYWNVLVSLCVKPRKRENATFWKLGVLAHGHYGCDSHTHTANLCAKGSYNVFSALRCRVNGDCF